MKAKSRTEEELIQELEVLRRRVASMEESRGKGAPEEEARRDGEERYRLFFEESRDAMSISSADGKVVEVNQGCSNCCPKIQPANSLTSQPEFPAHGIYPMVSS